MGLMIFKVVIYAAFIALVAYERITYGSATGIYALAAPIVFIALVINVSRIKEDIMYRRLHAL